MKWLKRWFHKHTNGYAYWTGYHEGLLIGVERGRELARTVAEVLEQLRKEER